MCRVRAACGVRCVRLWVSFSCASSQLCLQSTCSESAGNPRCLVLLFLLLTVYVYYVVTEFGHLKNTPILTYWPSHVILLHSNLHDCTHVHISYVQTSHSELQCVFKSLHKEEGMFLAIPHTTGFPCVLSSCVCSTSAGYKQGLLKVVFLAATGMQCVCP